MYRSPESEIISTLDDCRQKLRPGWSSWSWSGTIEGLDNLEEMYHSLRVVDSEQKRRQDLWTSIAFRKRESCGYEDSSYFEGLDLSDTNVGKDNLIQIKKDLHRSGDAWDDVPEKDVWVGRIESILKACTVYFKDEGYTQGMNLLGSELLYVTRDMEATFWLIVYISEDIIPQYFTRFLSGVKCDVWVIQQLLVQYFQDLVAHLKLFSFDLSFVLLRPLLSLFASCLSGENLYSLYDVMLTNPQIAVFAAWLAFFDIHKMEFMAQLSAADMIDTLNIAMEGWQSESFLDEFHVKILKWIVILDPTAIENLRTCAPTQWVNIELLIKARHVRSSYSSNSKGKRSSKRLSRSTKSSVVSVLNLRIVWVVSNLRNRFWHRESEKYRSDAVFLCKEILAIDDADNLLMGTEATYVDRSCSPLLPPDGTSIRTNLDNRDLLRTSGDWAVLENYTSVRSLTEGLVVAVQQLVQETGPFEGSEDYIALLEDLQNCLMRLGDSFPVFLHAQSLIQKYTTPIESSPRSHRKWHFWRRENIHRIFGKSDKNSTESSELKLLHTKLIALLLLRKVHDENEIVKMYDAIHDLELQLLMENLSNALIQDICANRFVPDETLMRNEIDFQVNLWKLNIEDSLYLQKWQVARVQSIADEGCTSNAMLMYKPRRPTSHSRCVSTGGIARDSLDPHFGFNSAITSKIMDPILMVPRIDFMSEPGVPKTNADDILSASIVHKDNLVACYWAARNSFEVLQQVAQLLDLPVDYKPQIEALVHRHHYVCYILQVQLAEASLVEYMCEYLYRSVMMKPPTKSPAQTDGEVQMYERARNQLKHLQFHPGWKTFLGSLLDHLESEAILS